MDCICAAGTGGASQATKRRGQKGKLARIIITHSTAPPAGSSARCGSNSMVK